MSKKVPTFDSLMNPLLNALFELGGSGSIDEIYEKVLVLEDIDEEISSVPEKGVRLELNLAQIKLKNVLTWSCSRPCGG